MDKKNFNYQDLDIYKLSLSLAVEINSMTKDLPKNEFWETGSQIRRSAKSIPANIAEGYGRKRYKNEYIKFLVYTLSSGDETKVHLELLFKCGSIFEDKYNYFNNEYMKLGRMISNFLNAICQGRAN